MSAKILIINIKLKLSQISQNNINILNSYTIIRNHTITKKRSNRKKNFAESFTAQSIKRMAEKKFNFRILIGRKLVSFTKKKSKQTNIQNTLHIKHFTNFPQISHQK